MSKEQSEGDEDSFNFEMWRQHRSKTQPLPTAHPPKRTGHLDSKKTNKYSEDPIIEHLLNSIIRQSSKFPEQQLTVNQPQQVQQFKPELINGVVGNPHMISKEEKEELGLSDEGHCLQFQINERYVVVVVGRLGYLPLEGANVRLYLPTELASYLASSTARQKELTAPDSALYLQKQGRIYIKIRRKLLNKKQLSILDYPYFVIDPNNLLYPTYLCSWIDCKRRISIANYVSGDKQVNEHMVYGNTCHRLLEWLSQGKVTPQHYSAQPLQWIKQLYDSMLYDMFLIRKSFEEFIQVCRSRMDNLVSFYQMHIIEGKPLEVDRYNKTSLKIEKVIESEIMLRSSLFGLKGKIDLLLYGKLIDGKLGTQKAVYVPMQLKTGRRVSDAHKRQTDIYNMLVKEKYRKGVIGLLYYSDSDIKFFRYEDPLSAYEIVISSRNFIAQNILLLTSKPESVVFPAFPPSLSQCNYCEVSSICEVSYRCIQNEEGTVDLSVMPSKQHQSIKSELQTFRKSEIEYIRKWFRLIHLEEQEQEKASAGNLKSNLFRFQLGSRELGCLLLESSQRARIQLVRSCANQEELNRLDEFYRPSFKMRCIVAAVQLLEGCKVVETAVEASHLLFKMVIEMNNFNVYVNKYKAAFNLEHAIDCQLEIELFASYTFANLRSAVLQLVKSDSPIKQLAIEGTQSQKLRAHEQERQEQQAGGRERQEQQARGREADSKYCSQLNADQTQAFLQATSGQDLTLIQGMPGTGKTELILSLIHYFHSQGLRTLVATFTNRSLDNVLQRLLDSKRVEPECLIRQGSQYSVSSSLKGLTAQTDGFTSIDDYVKYFSSKRVWFVTLSSLHIHHLPERFDVVIVDEASQCLQPSCVGALMRGRRYVVIGDYLQLQPVVRCRQALQEGMGVSLFERLCKSMPSCRVALRKQYRMNEKIMALSNHLVYAGQLQLASKQVQSRRLQLPASWLHAVPPSFADVLHPDRPVVFLNYDPIMYAITRTHASKEREIRKVIETELPTFILKLFLEAGLPPVSLGLIAALNISVNRMKGLVRTWKCSEEAVLTIDKSQGIDKEVIVLLIEKANEQLVQNPRRLNVALTRAKCKLVIVASEEYLSNMKLWKGMLGEMLRQYQIELTKAMIFDMIKTFAEPQPNH